MKRKTPKKKVTLENIAKSIANLDIKIEEKIDELALATAKGFEESNTRTDNVEAKLSKTIRDVEKTLAARIDGLDSKVDDLNFHKVRDEVYALTKRVSVVENKVAAKA